MRTVRRIAVAALAAATVTSGLAAPAGAKPRPDRTFDLQRVIELGVDGVITDDPALLVGVAIRNGLR